MKRLFLFTVLASACSVVAAGQPVKSDALSPLPEGSAIELAEKLVKDVYKADYAKKKATDQVELARKLLKAAEETKESAARYVMLREARELAAKGGDVPLALEASSVTALNFAVNVIEMKVTSIELAEKAKTAPPRTVAEAALDIVDEAIRIDDYTSADRLMKLAVTAAARSGVATVSAAVAARTKDLVAIRKTFETMENDRKTLAANAADPPANAKVGRFVCLLKGDWDAGLPLLAKGSDERLKAVAELDLTKTTGSERSVVADRWYEMCERLEPFERSEARLRAYSAYLQASVEATGLERTRIEKRLAEIEKLEPKIARLRSGWTVIFRASDPKIWNTDVSVGRDQLAISLDKVAVGIKYLKLTECTKNQSVILEMTKDRLTACTEQDGFGWNGKNDNIWRGNHLGIYNLDWKTDTKNLAKQLVDIHSTAGFSATRGWGFGNRTQNDVQGYSWNGEPIEKATFEIAVRTTPISAFESARLLKKK